MKIAIYTRVSSSMQVEDGHSLDAQRRLLVDYAKAREYTIYNIYSDEGISGKNTHKRPEFQQMIADAKTQSFDAILVWKLSRFSRSLKDLLVTVADLEKQKITLISYSENIDLSSAVGKLMFNIIGAFAEFERETIADNVRMGLFESAQQGNRTCAFALGYKLNNANEFVVDKKTSKIVKLIFNQYLDTKNIKKTTDIVNGMRHKGLRGRKFSCSAILTILTNTIYCGYSRYKGSIFSLEKIVEPIISEDDFNQAQSILTENSKKFGKNNYYPQLEEILKNSNI